jgi:hypothetical protein
MTADDLLALARLYLVATRVSRSWLGQASCGNRMIFFRLEEGKGCHSTSLERAHAWFAEHWHETGVPWPAEIPKPRPPRGKRDGWLMSVATIE